MNLSMREAVERDTPAIRSLLESAGLPTESVGGDVTTFYIAEDDGALVGIAGFEYYGTDALLRSVAVPGELRGKGVGSRIVGFMLDRAKRDGTRRIVLLTRTARTFFEQKGFRVVARESLMNPALTSSSEFAHACPASATCMALDLESPHKTQILVLCTGNSCRSQMAEAFLRSFDPSLEVVSAGTHPAGRVHPLAIRVMQETGIDLGNASPKSVDQFTGCSFDYVITVCDDAREVCPVFTGRVGRRLHIGFEDPARATGTEEERVRIFRLVRDQIGEEFRKLATTISATRA